MSQNRLRELREKIAQLNEQVQEYRRKIADKKTSAADVVIARTAFNKAMDDVDVLVQERDQLIADNEREARADRLDKEDRGTTRPPQDHLGNSAGADVARPAFRSMTRRCGVMVSRS